MASISLSKYAELIAEGRAIYAEQFRSIERNWTVPKPLPRLEPWYHTVVDAPGMPAISAKGVVKEMHDEGQPETGYVFIQADNTGTNVSNHDQTPYQNYVHVGGKAILCMSNYASRDHLATTANPQRIFWSDLMATCFHRVVAFQGGDLTGLQFIWRINIANETTQDVITYIANGRQSSVDVAAGEDGFFALLATVHGKGPARMLGAYPQMFGRKYISRVRIIPSGGMPSFYWILDEVPLPSPPSLPPPDDQPLSRKGRRQQKKRLSRGSTS